MIQLFLNAPATHKTLPASQSQAVVSECQTRALTGLAEFNGAETRAMLLFVEGLVLESYRLAADARDKLDPAQLSSVWSGETLSVRVLELPLEAVRAAKVLLDWYPPAETEQVEAGALKARLAAWSLLPANNVVHVACPDAEGLVILPGGVPPAGAIWIAGEQVKSGADGLAALYAQSAPCRLIRYQARADDALARDQIAQLRTAFNVLVEPLVARYAELLGANMTAALMLDVNNAAARNGWRIRLTTNGVADTHMFDSPEAAAQAYRSLVGVLIKHMTVVIGPRLAGAAAAEALGKLGPQIQQTVQMYKLAADAAWPGPGKR